MVLKAFEITISKTDTDSISSTQIFEILLLNLRVSFQSKIFIYYICFFQTLLIHVAATIILHLYIINIIPFGSCIIKITSDCFNSCGIFSQ